MYKISNTSNNLCYYYFKYVDKFLFFIGFDNIKLIPGL